jgi:hypothetical protein
MSLFTPTKPFRKRPGGWPVQWAVSTRGQIGPLKPGTRRYPMLGLKRRGCRCSIGRFGSPHGPGWPARTPIASFPTGISHRAWAAMCFEIRDLGTHPRRQEPWQPPRMREAMRIPLHASPPTQRAGLLRPVVLWNFRYRANRPLAISRNAVCSGKHFVTRKPVSPDPDTRIASFLLHLSKYAQTERGRRA